MSYKKRSELQHAVSLKPVPSPSQISRPSIRLSPSRSLSRSSRDKHVTSTTYCTACTTRYSSELNGIDGPNDKELRNYPQALPLLFFSAPYSFSLLVSSFFTPSDPPLFKTSNSCSGLNLFSFKLPFLSSFPLTTSLSSPPLLCLFALFKVEVFCVKPFGPSCVSLLVLPFKLPSPRC